MRERKKSIMRTLPKEFSERLNKLKQSFLNSLPERLSCIESALEVIGLESSSLVDLQQALNALQVKAHDLAGAAGTFGFIKLGELAYNAEIACGDLLASNSMPSLAERQVIGELLVAIRESGLDCLMHGAVANERRRTSP
jgi:HPt (histidine-containing phosphotransfer) domain-containing protein